MASLRLSGLSLLVAGLWGSETDHQGSVAVTLFFRNVSLSSFSHLACKMDRNVMHCMKAAKKG